MKIPYLLHADDTEQFPDVSLALSDPDGLLAIGGDLSPTRILSAYRQGIFPWYSEGQPIMWWSPDPRALLFPDKLKISRSLRKTLNKNRFTVSFDQAFPEVIRACAVTRKDGLGTWITDEMIAAYITLHELGYAHSVECWQQEKLVGGLYGISLGHAFFGESMFSRESDASKVALVSLVRHLMRWQFDFIDCQLPSEHLQSLGVIAVPRSRFIELLNATCEHSNYKGQWTVE